MIHKLKISSKSEEILSEIKTKFSITPNILSRIAVSLSLKKSRVTNSEIKKEVIKIDSQGLEFQRYTLTGENEIYYKIMMEQFCQSNLKDDEFFPYHFKFHLERGLPLLKSEIQIAPSLEVFLKNLITI